VTGQPESVRSYQRVFRPDRRIYSIDGKPLPVPGGVPLRWLAYATGTLIASIAVPAATTTVAMFGAAVALAAGLAVGGRAAAIVAAGVVFAGVEALAFVVGALDWPLRLVILPAAVATLATQKTPDGRSAERFAVSWIALRLAPRRRSLGRSLLVAGRGHSVAADVWFAPDEHSPTLRRGRVKGPSVVRFAAPVEEINRRRPGKRTVRRLGWHRRRGGVTSKVTLGTGEVMEVRP